jgi:hypothetical protein
MKRVIQVAEADDVRAWAMLVRHSAGVALPNRTFVISDQAVEALRREGIHFVELSTDGPTLTEQELSSCERI